MLMTSQKGTFCDIMPFDEGQKTVSSKPSSPKTKLRRTKNE